MSEIVKRSERVCDVSYSLGYDYNDSEPGHGFGFDCDAEGVVDVSGMSDVGKANLMNCKMGTNNTHCTGVHERVNTYMEPAVLECNCGEMVHLHNPLDNFCDCGECYNMSGQHVIPSSQCDAQGTPFSEYEDY